MIHAYHATFGTYGSWLPNDPRGSASRFVGGRKMYQHGGRADPSKRIKYDDLPSHEQRKYTVIQSQLLREAVVFNEAHLKEMAIAFEQFIADHRLQVWAAAILACHVHLVFARCGRKAELLVDELKVFCHERIVSLGISPLGCSSKNSVWAEGRWIVFLDKGEAIESAIAYVVQNPIEEGGKPQVWPFVVPFRGVESNIVSYRD